MRVIEVAPNMRMITDVELERRRAKFMEPLLLSHGHRFKAPKRTDDLPVFPFGGRCYDQALQIAISCNLQYCEGMVVVKFDGKRHTLAHAWCVDDSWEVHDPTSPFMVGSPYVLYAGVRIKHDYALAWKEKYGYAGMLDGHPTLGDTVGVYADPAELWKA